jgi:hypothetical protein
MLDLKELLRKIDTLQIAEENDALKKPDGKISDLKKASFDLCKHIYEEISQCYPDAQRVKFPSFDNHIINTSFNLEYLNSLKSHACYAAYLAAKNIPSEGMNLDFYLIMAENHGFPFIRVVEFYKNYCTKLTYVMTAEDFKLLYTTSKTKIDGQFLLKTGKGRFLDLMVMIEIIRTAQSRREYNFSTLIKNFQDRIAPALKLFEQTLQNATTAMDFNKFFATGAMHPYYSAKDFIAYVQTIKAGTNLIQNSNQVSSMSKSIL